MLDVTINIVAILVAALASIVIGAIWYAPPVFGKRWEKLAKIDTKRAKKERPRAYLGMAILSLITAYVLAHIVGLAYSNSWLEGAQVGFWVWLGFTFTVLASQVLFSQGRKKVFLINAGFYLVNLVVMGAILGAWR